MTDQTDIPVPSTEWHELQARLLWKVRAFLDPSPEHHGWYWAAYVRSPTRNVSMASTGHLDDYRFARWPTEEAALDEARQYLLEWEAGRPGF